MCNLNWVRTGLLPGHQFKIQRWAASKIDHDPTFAGKFFNNVGEEPVKVERGLSAQIKTDLFQLI